MVSALTVYRTVAAQDNRRGRSTSDAMAGRTAGSGSPRLSPVLGRSARLAGRDLDADGGAVLAGARADGLAAQARADRHAAVRAHARLLLRDRRPRRSGAQAASHPRDAGGAHVSSLCPLGAGLGRARAVLARRGARDPLRPRPDARHARPPGVHRGSRRQGRYHERHRAQLDRLQRGTRDRPRRRRPARGPLRGGRRVLPQRRELRGRRDRAPPRADRGRVGPARPAVSVLITGALVVSAATLALAAVRSFWLAATTLLVVGCAQIVFTAGCNTTLQLTAPDRMRGRIMSLYALVFVGASPFGSFFVGSVAEKLGVPAACALGGGGGLVLVALLALRWSRRGSAQPLAGS